MNKQQAYNAFWSQFGVFAFEENAVPTDDVINQLIATGPVKSKFPYITYQVITDDLNQPIYPIATIWDKNSSWKRSDELSNSILQTIKNTNIIQLDEGGMFITTGTPFAQHMSEEGDRTIRRILINLSVEFFT